MLPRRSIPTAIQKDTMNVLIIGGAGFIGHVVAQEFIAAGDSVVVEKQDTILFEPARLFRFMVKVFNLTEKALRGDLLFAFTGDAAALITGGTEAGQCLFGLKIVEGDAIDPLTGLPLLCQFITNEDGIDKNKKTYHGAQSTNCCLVAGACLMKENDALRTKCFHRISTCLKDINTHGLK